MGKCTRVRKLDHHLLSEKNAWGLFQEDILLFQIPSKALHVWRVQGTNPELRSTLRIPLSWLLGQNYSSWITYSLEGVCFLCRTAIWADSSQREWVEDVSNGARSSLSQPTGEVNSLLSTLLVVCQPVFSLNHPEHSGSMEVAMKPAWIQFRVFKQIEMWCDRQWRDREGIPVAVSCWVSEQNFSVSGST